ncbi:MAG: hypothetical protein ACWGMZ_11630, partial [Thermoguttaceae bacterium]
MLLNRTKTWVAVGFLVLLTSNSVFAQGLRGMQVFAPADLSTRGRGQQANEGFFFSYDGLYWSISGPRVTTVGKEGLSRNAYNYIPPSTPAQDPDNYLIVQSNTLDTSQLQDAFTLGNRIEVGRVVNNHGWMVSVFEFQELGLSDQRENVTMTFDEAAFGPLSRHILDGAIGGGTLAQAAAGYSL